MNYCPKCGAYIPEGQTECVACGGADVPKAPEAPAVEFEQPDRTPKTTSERTGGTPSAEIPPEKPVAAESIDLLAVISYFGALCVLPFFLKKDNEFTIFHAKQGVILLVISVILDALGSALPFAWILSIARVYLMIKGISNAWTGKKEYIPWVGKYAEKF